MVSPPGGESAGWWIRRVVNPPGGGSAGDECAGDESAGGESAGHHLKYYKGDMEKNPHIAKGLSSPYILAAFSFPAISL